MSAPIRELFDVHVNLDRVERNPGFSGTPEKPYAFVYHITIDNQSPEAVTIKGRKWILRDSTGETLVYEGDGVVGVFPRIEPGERFHYSSYHLIGTNSTAEGAYLGVNDQGEAVLARIPRFEMTVPPEYS